MALAQLFPKSKFSLIVTVLIVGAWAVLMGSLIRDRYFPDASDLAQGLKFSTAEADDWFLIRIGGAFAGYGRARQFREGPNWRLRDELNISLNIQGQVKPIRIRSDCEVDQDFRLISFHTKVASGIVAFDNRGRMEGKTLVLDVPGSTGGGEKRLKLFEVPRMSRALGLPVPLTGLKVGELVRMPIFDPLDGKKWDAEIRVLEMADLEIAGKKVAAWRVKAVYRTIEVVMWVDDDGRLLKGLMPLGITVVRSDKQEVARETVGARDLPEMMALAAVPVEGSIPEGPDLNVVRLRVEGAVKWTIPNDGFRQKVSGTEITLTRERLPQATYALPSKDPRMEEHLSATRFIRSDDPLVMQKAREIVGEEKDPVAAARLINTWVYSHLKKVPTPSVPDAVIILQSAQGDCNEHAVLAAALARAVGLPARIAVGLVYSGDGFYYHAWVTYWSGTTWFTADPLMNRLPVTPSYVTLLYGDVDKHVNVISFLGRLKITILGTG